MGIFDALYWTRTKRDGSSRSIFSMIIDPVGVCLEPSGDLEPFSPPDEIDVPAVDGENGVSNTTDSGEVVADDDGVAVAREPEGAVARIVESTMTTTTTTTTASVAPETDM